ncbi:putative membrane protein [Mycobacterium xenopi 4042]|uniref:Putative membrane protein n=1 Tax=Mycobacterium xenopi 4042 TaxID=1299334 RepID=X8ANA6_MYCXE|nr:putative membrane protein [Mycobacterium xenopi 4042]
MADPTSRKLLVVFALIFAVTVWVVFGVLSLLVVILALSTLFWFIVAIIALVTGWIPATTRTWRSRPASTACSRFSA